jgi:hypothetical protein
VSRYGGAKKQQDEETGEAASRRRLYEAVNPLQIETYRSWDGARKMRRMFEMFEFALRQTRLAVRSRHPDWSDEQIETEARRLVTGVEPVVIPIVISNTVFALGCTGLKEPVLGGFLAEKSVSSAACSRRRGRRNTAFGRAIGIR